MMGDEFDDFSCFSNNDNCIEKSERPDDDDDDMYESIT